MGRNTVVHSAKGMTRISLKRAAQDALRGLVEEDEVTRRVDHEDRHRQPRGEVADEDELDGVLCHAREDALTAGRRQVPAWPLDAALAPQIRVIGSPFRPPAKLPLARPPATG